MHIDISNENNQIILNIVGKISNTTCEEFKKTLLDAIEKNKEIILNFEKVDFINSSGLRVLLISIRKLEAYGRSLFVKNVNDVVMEVFQMTGFDDMFVMV